MFDELILYHGKGHEISKPCYFMLVYTNTSLEKSPVLKTQIEFQGSVWQLGECFLYIEKTAQENGCLNLGGQMTLPSAQSRRNVINGDHKQNTIL